LPNLERIDQKVRKSAAACKPTCRVLMFKLLILQRLYGLSDERLEYQVRDRFSGPRGWEARFRQEEGREQGVNCSGFSPQNISTRAKPLLIRPAASPHPNNEFIEVPLNSFVLFFLIPILVSPFRPSPACSRQVS